MTPKAWLFLALGLFVVYYAITWWRGVSTGDSATRNPPVGAIVINALIGAFFGWVCGGGVQLNNNVVSFAAPFATSDFGANVTMATAIGALAFLGIAVAFIHTRGGTGWPSPLELFIGFITNFFDTLGIGSYAPTTAMFKQWKLVDDKQIPGTLNVGHTPPTIAEALIFIAIVTVDFKTLILLLAASMLGAWLGAGVVAGWSKRNVQLGMGITLFIAALLFVIKNLDEMRGTPMIQGGDAIGLSGTLLAVGFIGNFALGALMTLGVGLYAPCLIMISLLGMNPTTAFPIMMGSCAFLMPVASARFITKKAYAHRPALGLTMAGIPAVLIAAFLVKSLSLTAVRWLVVIVVLYTSVSMLRSYRASGAPEPAKA